MAVCVSDRAFVSDSDAMQQQECVVHDYDDESLYVIIEGSDIVISVLSPRPVGLFPISQAVCYTQFCSPKSTKTKTKLRTVEFLNSDSAVTGFTTELGRRIYLSQL